MAAIGAPVLARAPVDATGCVPPPVSDGVVVPPLSFMVGAGVVVVLSSVGLGVGIGESEGVGESVGLGVGVIPGVGVGVAPGVGVGLEPGVGDGDVDDVALEMTV
ncbi:MAG: hypothetical protein WBL53_17535 [Pseudonocardiaceae bacterium]